MTTEDALSGYRLDDDEQELIQRRRNGELTQDEFIAEVVALVKRKPPSDEAMRAARDQQFQRVDHITQADIDAMDRRLAASIESLHLLAEQPEAQP